MKKIVIGVLAALLFIGCSSTSKDVAVEAKLVVNQTLAGVQLNDQFGKPHTIEADTKKVIFVFSKANGHACNEFFATKSTTYLQENKAVFVADFSAAPSLIRSMFIMPGLKDFNHTILVIDNKNSSAAYKTEENSENIVVASLENLVITEIKYLTTTQELEKELK
ncbi:MAG: hypothetical protein GW906_08585 [Epsilonproteobacteria bacterium]|nr:hypothetical protein [Campylobacterota bacterium]OIO18099.1 MAG: hypothetical protein AUJ81_00165 [Helicobacteraceae bacterium CG1_02_36_14]PIP09295.1 MAG: hypothetical protein COX50_11395 [Sulfurimonas sp. CG23_combo_of_CG06-09_8_20_14_all_36_33]PIS24348.1 MAG: hypothetical protein COT46_09370 [Sulfurimonas sp. CG08_land_8_20_14_0_20_36_33]PIU34433.1 MAG: hypothetical protein COT05_07385 [Sulfurimonas sp. CG07_land_8_20_14_0_80_36_56]PIV03064.1 MAG: hypothetical protein COS56_09625 [Sulfur